MRIGTIGYNNVHGEDFIIDRPNGPGSYLLLIIKTPARFWLKGQEHRVKKNTFIMLSPPHQMQIPGAGGCLHRRLDAF